MAYRARLRTLVMGNRANAAESTDCRLELSTAVQGSGMRLSGPVDSSTCFTSCLGRIFSCCKLL